MREEEELGSEFGTDERSRRDEQYPGNKSLVSTRNHPSPQILYSHQKLSEWFLPCMAMDKLGRQTFSETPKTRNQECCPRRRNGLFLHRVGDNLLCGRSKIG